MPLVRNRCHKTNHNINTPQAGPMAEIRPILKALFASPVPDLPQRCSFRLTHKQKCLCQRDHNCDTAQCPEDRGICNCQIVHRFSSSNILQPFSLVILYVCGTIIALRFLEIIVLEGQQFSIRNCVRCFFIVCEDSLGLVLFVSEGQ